LSEVFTAANIAKVTLLKDWGEKEMDGETEVYHSTRVFFPEFKAEFEGSVKDVLADKFGIHKLFDEYQCDVQNIYEYKQNEYVWCDDVLHQATLTVDRTGVEGAAVVYMPILGATSAAPIRYVYHDFVVDRAFGFVITSYNGGMVFSGVINSVD
jgi:serine protease inhibitor